jgi:branched-chain amino acid transport system ATP-binding protein
MATLTLSDVSAGYHRPQTAIDGVSLVVRSGEIIALMGSNGAGKTTTLAAISGLLQPWAGRIDLDNHRIDQMTASSIVRAGIAQVPEGRQILPGLSVRENLEMGAYVLRDRAQILEVLEEVLQLFPVLKDRLKQPGGTLSGGEQEMLAIARALMCRPSILLLDEPSMGLAPVIVGRIFEHLSDLQARGIGMLLVEQNARMALRIATFAHVMEQGSLTVSGRPSELNANERVRQAYLGA